MTTRRASSGRKTVGGNNYLLQSEAFDNVAWTATNLTVSGSKVANPLDGALTAQQLLEVGTGSPGRNVSQIPSPTTSPGVPHTLSVYAKRANRQFIVLLLNSNGNNENAFFDLLNGVVTTNAGGLIRSLTKMTNVGNGWYRCQATAVKSAGSTGALLYTSDSDGTFTYAGVNGQACIQVYGAQLEQGAVASPYVATQGSQILLSRRIPQSGRHAVAGRLAV